MVNNDTIKIYAEIRTLRPNSHCAMVNESGWKAMKTEDDCV